MYNSYDNEWYRQKLEAERKLIRELSGPEPMSWRKLGKMIQLNALLRSHDRRYPFS